MQRLRQDAEVKASFSARQPEDLDPALQVRAVGVSATAISVGAASSSTRAVAGVRTLLSTTMAQRLAPEPTMTASDSAHNRCLSVRASMLVIEQMEPSAVATRPVKAGGVPPRDKGPAEPHGRKPHLVDPLGFGLQHAAFVLGPDGPESFGAADGLRVGVGDRVDDPGDAGFYQLVRTGGCGRSGCTARG
ncbi:MAG: hypothetical protein ACRDTT_04265 [Pseudonocardiaceae bacterium]